MDPNSQIIIYQTPDGTTKIDVNMEGETVWLTQEQMAILFCKGKSTINEHILNIYAEGELKESDSKRKIGITDFSTKPTNQYNLDVIISVGYRVKSLQGTHFRIWATQIIKEYLVKGFAMNDERLKEGGNKARYFVELLARIRDIRSSERNFYQKVTDIYVTSIDYKKDTKLTHDFFATVQNKMHYAVHGHTAAEIIASRADANMPLMGLTSFNGDYITPHDVHVAKNYLSETEIKQLNLIVSLYLDFAELQASNNRPMTMQEWIDKLDEFLRISEKKTLNHFGSVSAKEAEAKALIELKKYRQNEVKNYLSDFDREVKKLKLIKINKAI